MAPEDINRFAKMILPDYDLYKKYGFSKGRPVGVHEAADRIVGDMLQSGYYLDFVELLVKLEAKGYMGRKYALRGLDDVINDILQAGYEYDETTGLFFEDQDQRVTRNWGRLVEGDERLMAVLRLDIVGNSAIVKNNPRQQVDKTYTHLRKIVDNAVVSRLGRLWTWEGDGALAVFMLGDYSRMSIFAAMEILDAMFLFNKMDNPLDSEIKLRIAVHSGSFIYSSNDTKISKTDIIKKTIELESKAATPNSLVISESLAMSQDQALLDIFSSIKTVSGATDKYRAYHVVMGKS
jgi:class 3 adenylate cyclase